MFGDGLGYHNWAGWVPLASTGQRPRMQVSTPQCTGQPLQSYPIPSAEVRKPHSSGVLSPSLMFSVCRVSAESSVARAWAMRWGSFRSLCLPVSLFGTGHKCLVFGCCSQSSIMSRHQLLKYQPSKKCLISCSQGVPDRLTPLNF